LNNLIAIDSLIVKFADVRYSEYAEDGVRPGTVLFGKTNAIVTNINNRSTEAIVLKANTLLQNTGDIDTEIRLSRESVNVKGSMKSFDIMELNSIFMDLEGIEIRAGIAHALSFDFEMRELDSIGEMHIFYDDLRIAQINKDDHSRNLGKRITDILINELVLLETSRKDDMESKKGEISATREPEQSFFTYLWISLRSGIFDVVKR